jgi:hypothetical protein
VRRLPAVVALVGLAGLGMVGSSPAAQVSRTVEASAPRTIGFGDALEYLVEATVPTPEADAALITADVGAFSVLATAPLERERRGAATILRLRRTLACLDRACLGPRPSRALSLPAPRVSSPAGSALGIPSAVVVRGRVSRQEVAAGLAAYRRDSATPPEADGPGPARVARVLTGIAAAALLGALALVSAPRRRRRPATPHEDGFARAVRLVRESARRPDPDRRRAADLLARLAADRDEQLGAGAARVAWSPSRPSSAEVEALAERAAKERT